MCEEEEEFLACFGYLRYGLGAPLANSCAFLAFAATTLSHQHFRRLAHASTRSAGHIRPGGATVVVPVESWRSYSTRWAIVELARSAVEPLSLLLLSRVVVAAPLTRM